MGKATHHQPPPPRTAVPAPRNRRIPASLRSTLPHTAITIHTPSTRHGAASHTSATAGSSAVCCRPRRGALAGSGSGSGGGRLCDTACIPPPPPTPCHAVCAGCAGQLRHAWQHRAWARADRGAARRTCCHTSPAVATLRRPSGDSEKKLRKVQLRWQHRLNVQQCACSHTRTRMRC